MTMSTDHGYQRLRRESVRAHVGDHSVLRDGFDVSDGLSVELQAHAKRCSAARSCPRDIAFLDALPMIATGKVMPRELRAIAINEVEADRISDESIRS